MKTSDSHYYIVVLFLTIFMLEYSCYSQDFNHVSRITDGLDAPLRLAVDNMDNVYITDTYQKNIVKYDADGNFLGTIEPDGKPISIAINKENLIVYGDGENSKVIKLNPDGTSDVIYSDPLYPSSMVISPDNLLYIVDNLSKQVLVLDLNGNLIQTFGNDILLLPSGIAYDQYNDRILVAEHGGIGSGFNLTAEIKVFDPQGNLVNTIGSYGNGDGEFYRIQGIALGPCGNIYAIDSYQGKISVFDENGAFLSAFGEYGADPGQFNLPMDVAFNSNSHIFVTSMNNGSVEVFKITDSFPTSHMSCQNPSICEGDTTEIEVAFTGTSPWTFAYTIDGINPTTISNVSENPYILAVSEAGIYEVSSLSDANSQGTCFTGVAEIFVSPTPSSFIASAETIICPGDTADILIEFTGNAPWSFSYTVNALNPETVNYISN
ncbi:NHL repeat-containing protein, partial [Bacteroidota bacterium]